LRNSSHRKVQKTIRAVPEAIAAVLKVQADTAEVLSRGAIVAARKAAAPADIMEARKGQHMEDAANGREAAQSPMTVDRNADGRSSTYSIFDQHLRS
jgi:hypothetical protein